MLQFTVLVFILTGISLHHENISQNLLSAYLIFSVEENIDWKQINKELRCRNLNTLMLGKHENLHFSCLKSVLLGQNFCHYIKPTKAVRPTIDFFFFFDSCLLSIQNSHLEFSNVSITLLSKVILTYSHPRGYQSTK